MSGAERTGLRAQGQGHAGIERTANFQPPAVVVTVTGEVRPFGDIASSFGCTEAIPGKVTQRRAQYGIIAQIEGIVIGGPAHWHGGRQASKDRAGTWASGGEMDRH